MGVVMFYHLMRSGADDTLMSLITRARSRGWRVMVRGRDPARLARLDDLLWSHPGDEFVPHGREGGAHDRDQPILLGEGPAINGAEVLALIDSAEVTMDEARKMERVSVLFDGGDSVALDAARALWRKVTEAGISAQYWSDDSGNWQMKMEKVAPEGLG